MRISFNVRFKVNESLACALSLSLSLSFFAIVSLVVKICFIDAMIHVESFTWFTTCDEKSAQLEEGGLVNCLRFKWLHL